jgi:hypothetical protein
MAQGRYVLARGYRPPQLLADSPLMWKWSSKVGALWDHGHKDSYSTLSLCQLSLGKNVSMVVPGQIHSHYNECLGLFVQLSFVISVHHLPTWKKGLISVAGKLRGSCTEFWHGKCVFLGDGRISSTPQSIIQARGPQHHRWWSLKQVQKTTGICWVSLFTEQIFIGFLSEIRPHYFRK